MSNCTKCHELGEEPSNEKCLDCHKEIKELISAKRGFHSSSEVDGNQCFTCHSEHNGRDFDMLHFDKDGFDHSKTGYNLIGKHSKTDCEKCHQAKNIRDPELRKRKSTYLGMNTNCLSCHNDYHAKQLSEDCSSCHGFDTFKPAVKFDHNKSKFKLTGKHKTTDCAKCHKEKEFNDSKTIQFTGLDFNSCESCHTDFHIGKFGKDCQSCHTTNSFRNIKSNSKFNHSMTNYPLIGKHNQVDCQKCHGNSTATRPAYKQCIDCHSDFHKGQLVKEGKTIDCAECHNVYGFEQTLFGIERHQKLKFSLIGSHVAVPCSECHFTGIEWKFKFSSLQCSICHENPHGNSISKEFMGELQCENCHNSNEWKSVKFNHSQTKFELLGKHSETKCGECHTKTDNLGKKEYSFSGLSTQCETCHTDKHNAQFKQGNFTDCSRCHNFSTFKKASKFNHDNTRFKLDGKHINVDCAKCHKPVTENKITFVQYKIKEITCESCHS